MYTWKCYLHVHSQIQYYILPICAYSDLLLAKKKKVFTYLVDKIFGYKQFTI